jgi:peptide/nickel transport system permease protein
MTVIAGYRAIRAVRGAWLRWRLAPRSFQVGAVLLLLHLLLGLFGPALAPYGLAEMNAGPPLSGLSLAHPFGTDALGRDVVSRVMHGAPIVLLLAFSGTALGFAVGTSIGLVCGYLRNWLDELVQRLIEALISIPFLVLALMAIAAAGPSLSGQPILIILVVALVYAPRTARLARAAALDVVARDFVSVARLRGDPAWTVVWRELLPNAMGSLFVEFSLRAGYAPVLVGSLGFLGFGLRPPTPEWGLLISENRSLMFVTPLAVLGPGAVLASLVVGLNLFTEGLARMLGRTEVIARV